jgi:hypothetical protein
MLHGWCSSACKPPPFSSKHNDGHYGPTVLFLLHQTREQFSKKDDLCPHVQLQTVVWLFLDGFGAVASSLLSGLSGDVDIVLFFSVDIDTFEPVSSQGLCCCSGIVSHFSHESTFISMRQNASPS